MTIRNLDKIYSDAFGLWISGLFSAIEGNNTGMTFDDHREAFFAILKLWLDQGKIRFCTPSDPLGEVWDAPSAQIVDYLKARWPRSATHAHDSDLNLYFYDIPALFWVGADGQPYRS